MMVDGTPSPVHALGRLRVHVVSDCRFRLDGGAMFGVVPKTLWSRVQEPDEFNRIGMATHCLLIEAGDALVLVDTGIGDKGDAKFHEIFAIDEGDRRLPAAIRDAGFELEQVSHVLLTHLHFDHCGWNTRREGDELVPTFPNARYWIEAGELAHALAPNERDRASYDRRNFEPLRAAGLVETFDGEVEPVPGVRLVRAPGHNEHHCIVTLDGGEGARGVYWADLIPTVAHVPLPWIMGYDLYPMQTLASKKAWIPRAVAGDWLCWFEHDDGTPVARLREERPGKYGAVPPA